MKKIILLFTAVAIALAGLVWAQQPLTATVRTPSGERQVQMVQHGEQPLFPVDEVLSILGGTVARDPEGFRAKLNEVEVSFASDSRYAVMGNDMVEMPEPPLVVEGRAFVPWQFFGGFLRAAAGLETSWNAAASVLELRPAAREVLNAEASVVDLQGMTKIVIQLSGRTEYAITREPSYFSVRLSSPIRPQAAEQTVENPLVSRISYLETEIRIELKTAEVTADAYRLEAPFRIVIDLRPGAAPTLPGAAVQPGPAPAADPPGIRTIVIDPGHGGKESGAVGPGGLLEKDATLAISRKLAGALERRLGTRVVLTRTGDELVTLDHRTAIANQYKADLFLSIHLNASLIPGAHGSETYFLSVEASDELSRQAAERENASAPAAAQPGGSDLRLILWDLAQQEYLKESSRLAEIIQTEMNGATGVQSRGVKQAPFKVLVGATMPAALIELGFISNPQEEAKIQDAAFQDAIVSALSAAVERYKNEYEVRIGVASPQGAAPVLGRQESKPAAPAGEARGTTPGG